MNCLFSIVVINSNNACCACLVNSKTLLRVHQIKSFNGFNRSQHVAEGSYICFCWIIGNIRSKSDSLQSVEKDLHTGKYRWNSCASDIHFFAIYQSAVCLAPLRWLLTWKNIKWWNSICKPFLTRYRDLPVGVNDFLCIKIIISLNRNIIGQYFEAKTCSKINCIVDGKERKWNLVIGSLCSRLGRYIGDIDDKDTTYRHISRNYLNSILIKESLSFLIICRWWIIYLSNGLREWIRND